MPVELLEKGAGEITDGAAEWIHQDILRPLRDGRVAPYKQRYTAGARRDVAQFVKDIAKQQGVRRGGN